MTRLTFFQPGWKCSTINLCLLFNGTLTSQTKISTIAQFDPLIMMVCSFLLNSAQFWLKLDPKLSKLALRMKHLENTGSQNPFGTTLDPILAKTRLNWVKISTPSWSKLLTFLEAKRFLTEADVLMMLLVILIWFDSHICKISAFYIEFGGIKNPTKDWWHCWRPRGHWSFLMMFLVILLCFDSHTCQISVFYIEFKEPP